MTDQTKIMILYIYQYDDGGTAGILYGLSLHLAGFLVWGIPFSCSVVSSFIVLTHR